MHVLRKDFRTAVPRSVWLTYSGCAASVDLLDRWFREMVPESELEEGDEEPQEVEPKRPRLAAPGKLEEEHDYVAELGKYALRASQRFHRLGFSSFVDETRGRSNITDTVGNISHPASGLLDDLRRSGAPVEFSSPALDADQLKEALEYGSHGSC